MLFEAVPNFSEGRDPEKIQRIVDAVRATPGSRVLDLHSDPDHNRSVLTFVGEADALIEASTILATTCAKEIDLTGQTGVHPRIGALDVLPFIPLEDTTMDDASRLAHRVGERLGSLGFPIFLYENAVTAPHRKNLADIRSGGYEGLSARIQTSDWKPDFGPDELDPRRGAIVVGARPFLIAFNAFLDTPDVEVARDIARKVRGRDGGLPGVKALGLLVGGHAQVSMNLTDLESTALPTALEAVRESAAMHGAGVEWTELVGMMPVEALVQTARHYLALSDFRRENILETGLQLDTDAKPTEETGE
ncbi:MAG: glutamate formimidoyltransferase [Actinomycetota bacterium]|nr:glutamate formimidoyltransferase [Actinomycetota bacterium]